MYEQTLLKIIEPIKKTTLTRLNRGKKWKYGYDKDHDLVVLSKTGVIGEIYDIQGFKIALPNLLMFSNMKARSGRRWISLKNLYA